MCGLVAITNYMAEGPRVARDELLSIREAMLSRGPDGEGLWMSGDQRVGLGHRRLSLLDLSEDGAQPMATADGALRIVFNGEIYNYLELRQALQARGYRFRSQTDTEVLLHLYADEGQEMVRRLRGMYAFAIWDEANKCLFAARDPLGIKPLYYSDDGKTLKLASQVKALMRGLAVNAARDPGAQVGFLLLGYVPEPLTCARVSRHSCRVLYKRQAGEPPTIRHFVASRTSWRRPIYGRREAPSTPGNAYGLRLR